MPFLSTQFGLKPSDVIGFNEPQRTAVEMQVTVSIANEATWLYKNFKPPRYRNSYGFAQIMSGAFVVRTVQLEHLNQEILHWRNTEWGINETTLCSCKGLAALLNPPGAFIGTNVKTRQRYTSVRVRLYPGVEANIALAWETAATACGNIIGEPDPDQGQPVSPNNGNADPGTRPADQGRDETDGSNNDGEDDPNDNLPSAPAAGEGSSFPHWHAHYTVKYPPGCSVSGGKSDYPAFINKAVPPVYTSEGNSACAGTTFGKIRIGGAVVEEPDDIVSIQFFYY